LGGLIGIVYYGVGTVWELNIEVWRCLGGLTVRQGIVWELNIELLKCLGGFIRIVYYGVGHCIGVEY
jgi:hypothetical protein